MATVADFTRLGLPPQTHAYDDASLDPLEFLQAVYRDSSLPMSIRIDAARGVLPFTEPRPASAPLSYVGCKIIIGGLGSSPEDPDGIYEKSQSFSVSASNNPHPSSEPPAPVNTETNSYPQTFIDYSTPPTPAELQEIKAAINRLRPDLAHLPIPEPHLCQCGHWIFGPCPLAERCRDKSSPNGDKSTLN